MWKTIENYDKYEVSDEGKVRNIRTGKVLGKRPDKDGYSMVYLYSNGKGTNKKVHRLVADAYLERDVERNQINHKNGIKDDNRVCNLEWCNRSENTRHAYANGLFKANIQPAISAHTKITDKERTEIIRMRNNNIPIKEIANMYGISLSTAYIACRKKEVI